LSDDNPSGGDDCHGYIPIVIAVDNIPWDNVVSMVLIWRIEFPAITAMILVKMGYGSYRFYIPILVATVNRHSRPIGEGNQMGLLVAGISSDGQYAGG
jgi:hypothetical protein